MIISILTADGENPAPVGRLSIPLLESDYLLRIIPLSVHIIPLCIYIYICIYIYFIYMLYLRYLYTVIVDAIIKIYIYTIYSSAIFHANHGYRGCQNWDSSRAKW